MQGQRIIERLTRTGAEQGISKRDLKKRVSVQYRKAQFEQDFQYLLDNNIIAPKKVGRETRVVVTCPATVTPPVSVSEHFQAELEPLPVKPLTRNQERFPLGSRVKAVGFGLTFVNKNNPYGVVVGHRPSYVGVDISNGNINWPFFPSELELAPESAPEPIKVGDRVLISPELNPYWAGEGTVTAIYSSRVYDGGMAIVKLETGRMKADSGGFDYKRLTKV